MKFYWTVAWRNLWRHKRRSLITAFAMAIGVALCMSMICWSDGMYDEMFKIMVEQQLGHVQVHHPDYPAKGLIFDSLGGREALLAEIDGLEGTVAASPRIDGFALLGGETKSAGGLLVGIDPARHRLVSNVHERMVEGEFLSDAASHEMIIGHKLAEEIQVGLGDEVVAVTQATDGSTGNDLYTVVGIYKTGNEAMDHNGAFLHIDDTGSLLALVDQAHGITVLTDHADNVESYAVALGAAVATETVQVQTWWDASPMTAQMMGMRDFTAIFLLGIVFAVAAFGVVNTMMMSVYERTREMGVLRALGLRKGKLVWLVVCESFFLATLAASIGLVIGGLLDWYLVVHGIDFTSSMGGEGFSWEGVMFDPVMKGAVNVGSIVLTVVAVYVVSVLASLWPAWRATRLQPVTAIRED
jgi:ABC-type lipoprotein release transport system permease subunit